MTTDNYTVIWRTDQDHFQTTVLTLSEEEASTLSGAQFADKAAIADWEETSKSADEPMPELPSKVGFDLIGVIKGTVHWVA